MDPLEPPDRSGRADGRQPRPDATGCGCHPGPAAVAPPASIRSSRSVEGGRRAEPLVLTAVARPQVAPDRDPDRVRDRDVGQAHRLGRAAAVRPRDPGDRHREVGAGPGATAAGHRHRDLGRHRAVRREDVVGHADRLALELVGVRHEAPDEVGARSWDLGDEVADETAGARFDGRDAKLVGLAALAEPDREHCQRGGARELVRCAAAGEPVVRHG